MDPCTPGGQPSVIKSNNSCQGFVQRFLLGVETSGIPKVNRHAQNRRYAKHALLGGVGTCSFEENSCPEIESGGGWQLADFPVLVFKTTA